MLSTTQSVVLFYKNIVNSPQLLADGYRLISSFLLESQQNRRETLLSLFHPQVPVLSLVMNVYPLQIMGNPAIQQSQKDSTIQFLLNLLTQQLLASDESLSDKKISQLLQMLHKIHNNQGFQRSVHLYMSSLNKLQVSTKKLGYFLLNILKYADDRIHTLSQQIFKVLVNYEFNSIQQKLQIIYYILKSLAFKVDSDPEAIQTHVAPYENTVVELACTHINRSPNTLKFSLKILTLLYGEYQIQCNNDIAKLVQSTALALITSYISLLNTSVTYEKGEVDLEQQEQEPIQVALYQILELCMVLIPQKVKLQLQIIVYLGIISTYLPQSQYKKYVQFSDQYLMDIDDEGEANVRNKSVFFLQQLMQHQKMGKKSVSFLKEYTYQILTNLSAPEQAILSFLQKHKLPPNTLKIHQLYRESMLFMFYSFTEQLMPENTQEIFVTLASEIKTSSSASIEVILEVLILNRCLKKSSKYHCQYAAFLREITNKYNYNIGMLISIARGIYEYSPQQQLNIVNSFEGGVPYVLVHNLLNYLLKNDSAQEESAFLVLQFFIHLIQKCPTNKPILQQIISFEQEVTLLKKFLNSGMSQQLVRNLTCKLQNPSTLQALYKEIQNGYCKDQSLSKIISKCLKNKSIFLTQQQAIYLCQVYSNRLDIISEIISAFLECNEVKNNEFVLFLSKKSMKQWIPGLIKQNKLMQIEKCFVESVNSLTNVIQSLEHFENQLLVPFYYIISQTDNAILLLNNHSLLVPFFQKLYRYAKLFQGTHLKIMTSHIFISLAQKISQLTPKVIELVRSYGKIDSSEWEDENDYSQFGTNEKATESILQRMFDKIVNERVEQVFQKIFGEISWDSNRLYHRLQKLQSAA